MSESGAKQLSVEEQRQQYLSDLMPLLPELDDWQLSLFSTLLYWSGPKAPGVPVRKSVDKICERIGSHRNQGRVPAKRKLVTSAAKRLIELDLLRRQENDCLWSLVAPRPSAAQPQWAAFGRYNARLWRRDHVPGGSRVRAAICRIAFHLDADGSWRGSESELAEILAVKSSITSAKRRSEILLADNSIRIEESWIDGRLHLVINIKAPPENNPDLILSQIRKAHDELWYPDLVEEAIAKTAQRLKGGSVTPIRQLNGFYQPALQLQKDFNNPPLIKYALEQTLKSGVFRGKSTAGWHRYARKVASNNGWRFKTASDPEEKGSDGGQLRQLELAMRELLGRAAQLNGTGDKEGAAELLPRILGGASKLRELFDGDENRCRSALRLAFKQGSTDFVGVKPDEYAPDYLVDGEPGLAGVEVRTFMS